MAPSYPNSTYVCLENANYKLNDKNSSTNIFNDLFFSVG